MKDTCKWILYDDGQFGCPDWEYCTECGRDHVEANDNVVSGKFCPFCGKKKTFK